MTDVNAPDHSTASIDTPGNHHGEPNRLANEKSPYLLQHAHNPVDWYPWGDEAFDKAKREGKPVFLSIGYSSCHWCHVMAHESFEDDGVARLLNDRFVSIKVDREERPDVDAIYMTAVQLTTGGGGWPLTAFLTSDRKPFFGGTYFPRDDRGGRMGFKSLLRSIDEAHRTRRADVEQSAARLSDAIAEHLSQASAAPDADLERSPVDEALAHLKESLDPRNGGFGTAPKFPPHGELRLLLQEYRRDADDEVLAMITSTLDAMAAGGIRDHLGGGFHRYSTDAIWLVPHFEKMLYDNAQLLRTYAEAADVTRNESYAGVAREIADWVLCEMTDEAGGFHSALDADSEGEEGKFYVWSATEIDEALGETDAGLFARSYGVEPSGNHAEEATGRPTGTNILHITVPVDELAESAGVDASHVAGRLDAARAKLLALRASRVRPGLDDKVLTSWNGLMIGALAFSGSRLGEQRYVEAAATAARFVLTDMRRDGRLLRTYRAGEAKLDAYLDDYALLADGLLELHRATGDDAWLGEARRLADLMIEHYADDRRGGFFFTSDDHERLLARSKEAYDRAVPSGNGVAVRVLLDLAGLTGDGRYAESARGTLAAYSREMSRVPRAMSSMIAGLSSYLDDRGDARARDGVVAAEAYASALTLPPGGSADIAIRITVDPEWHVNSASPAEEHLTPTRVTLADAHGLALSSIRFPEPVPPTSVLTGTVWALVRIDATSDAAPGERTAELRVHAQPCGGSECLTPVTLSLPVPVVVAETASTSGRHAPVFALARRSLGDSHE